MKVEIYKGATILRVSYSDLSGPSLIIIPESPEDEELLYSMYPQGITHKAFVKTELSLDDRIGLLIRSGKNDNEIQ